MSDILVAEFVDITQGRRDIVSLPRDQYMNERYASKGTKQSSHSQCVTAVKLPLDPAPQR
jgi:hypothetical protein